MPTIEEPAKAGTPNPFRQKLFNHMATEHGLTLLESEMVEIELICREGWISEAEAAERQRTLHSKAGRLWRELQKVKGQVNGRNANVIGALIAVARAAWGMADNTEEREKECIADADDFGGLSKALDVLDELPDPPGEAATGPRKAEYFLRAFRRKRR